MASEIRVNKINSRTGVGTITLSPTGVDFTGIATVATLKATTGIVTTFSATGNATVGGTLNVTGETTFATHINLGDSDKAKFGTSGDLEIYHDGSDSYVKDNGTGSLILETNGHSVDIKHGSEYCARFKEDADVELYFDNSVKLETKSDGVDITGELQCDTLDVDGNIDLDGSKITFDSGGNVLKWADNVAAYFGDGNDLRIYHDGSNSWITENGTGSLKIRSTAGSVQILGTTSNDNMAVFTVDGASELYYDNSKKFETTTSGVVITGNLNVAGGGDCALDIIADSDNNGTNQWPIINFRRNSATGTPAARIYHHETNGSLRFDNGGSERLRIQSGGGISFNGDSATANALNDYEEGNWTPAIYSGGWSSLTIERATYVKVGGKVFVQVYLSSLQGSGDGNPLLLSGLPFNPQLNGYSTSAVDMGEGSVKGAYCRTESNNNRVGFYYASENNSTARVTLKGNQIGDAYIIFGLTYFTDS